MGSSRRTWTESTRTPHFPVTSSSAAANARLSSLRLVNAEVNGIDPIDVNKSYRFEQGFTFELNLAGVSDQLRDDFAGTEKSKK